MKYRILLFEAFFIFLLIFKLSFAEENKKINIKFDKLDFDVLPVTNNDQHLMLIITVNNSTNLNDITEFVGLKEKGKESKPYFISPDINVNLKGLIFYKFGSNKINCGDDGIKELVDKKNKKSFTICGSAEIQKNIDPYLKDEIVESEIIYSLIEVERKETERKIDSASLISIVKAYNETLSFKDKEYLNKLFTYQYMMYYYEKYIEQSGINYLNRLDKSYFLGNRNDDFLKIYYDEALYYADTLFKHKNYDSLNIFVDSTINIFKNKNEKDSFKRLEFYKLCSEYYLMKTDSEIVDTTKNLIKKFEHFSNEFKETNKDLKYIALLLLGNINYIKGNYGDAIDLYNEIINGEGITDEIKDKAKKNKVKSEGK